MGTDNGEKGDVAGVPAASADAGDEKLEKVKETIEAAKSGKIGRIEAFTRSASLIGDDIRSAMVRTEDQKLRAEDRKRTMSAFLDTAVDKAPESVRFIKPYVAPVVGVTIDAIDLFLPVALVLFRVVSALWALVPQEALPGMAGAALLFFGGRFPVLIACCEAARMCGLERTMESIALLKHNFQVASEAAAKDDELDEDGDGIPDVQQISRQELVQRKTMLLLRTIDPVTVESGMTGIYTSAVAVLTTVRLQFAQTITMGATMGELAAKNILRMGAATFNALVAPDLQKWVGPSVRYSCRLVGVSVAFFVQRRVSAFYSALRGAQMLVGCIFFYYFGQHPQQEQEPGSKPKLRVAGKEVDWRYYMSAEYVVAFVGFYSQYRSAFNLSFPFNILLSPLSFAEWFIQNTLADGRLTATAPVAR